jgi:hypothetical protein
VAPACSALFYLFLLPTHQKQGYSSLIQAESRRAFPKKRSENRLVSTKPADSIRNYAQTKQKLRKSAAAETAACALLRFC